MSGLLGGVLPKIYEAGNRARRYKNALLQDPRGTINALAESLAVDINDQLSAPQWGNALRGMPADPNAVRAEQNKLAGLFSGIGAIKVYHGSPHTFTKADSSKIGTGEGAQAYGHGLYWAESPEVAKTYIPKSGAPSWEGKPVKSMTFDGTIEFADGSVGKVPDGKWNEFRAAMESGPRSGNLYEASLRWPGAREATDPLGPQHFLDWDKPLSQQPHVMKAISQTDLPAIGKQGLGWRGAPDGMYEKAMGNKTGEWLYREVADNDQAKTSALLRQLGIPGVSYMDAGSRAAGQGTRNYVTFDDALVDLLLRNGMPLK